MTTRIPAFRPAPLPCQAFLEVVDGPARGRFVEIASPRLRIGSAPDCDLVLDDPTVSRQHAVLELDASGPILHDLGSTNGTLVAGCRIASAYITSGAVFQLGLSKLRYVAVDAPAEAPRRDRDRFGLMIGKSDVMRALFARLAQIAASDATVLVWGETGTGKELVAEALHRHSPRQDGPFVVFDCGRISDGLIEEELFGHERGAFTGAVSERRGLLEEAAGGTLFLDEIGELPLHLQHKLLRFLERRQVARVGSNRTSRVDVRVVAATNRDLAAEVKAGRFRADLFYRLDVLSIHVPPLRERREEIGPLAEHFYQQISGDPSARLPEELVAELAERDWPGNVRELRSTLERYAHMGAAERHSTAQLPLADDDGVDPLASFKDAKVRAMTEWEKSYLRSLLRRCGGNIARAARAVRMSRTHLHELLRRHGIEHP